MWRCFLAGSLDPIGQRANEPRQSEPEDRRHLDLDRADWLLSTVDLSRNRTPMRREMTIDLSIVSLVGSMARPGSSALQSWPT